MRIAQRMVSRNYKSCINTTLGRRAEAFERGTTGLAFSKLSQNVAAGMRAMRVQEERENSERQLETVKTYMYEMNSVDSNLDSIDAILQKVNEKLLSCLNDPTGTAGSEASALEIEKLKEQLIQFANAEYAGKHLFGNTENGKPPFAVDDASGKLTFHGVPVEDIYIDPQTGKYMYTPQNSFQDPNNRLQVTGDPGEITFTDNAQQVKLSDVTYDKTTKQFMVGGQQLQDSTGFSVDAKGNVLYEGTPTKDYHVDNGQIFADQEVPEMGEIYVDLGAGMQFADGAELDPRTGFKVSFSGLDVLGVVRVGRDTPKMETGKQTGKEVPRNTYDLLTQAEAALRSERSEDRTSLLRDIHTQAVDLNDEMRASRTDLGARMNFLERSEKRLENDITNLSETENNLITADPAEEAINLKQVEYSWMALMQLGSMLLPSSLLDFMR